jgi:phage protein U
MNLGSFGSVIFETSSTKVETFNDLNLKSSAIWAKHSVIGSKPKKEYLSPELRSVSLIVLLSAYMNVNVKAEITKMRAMAESGEVNPLVIGSQNLGKYTLNSVSEKLQLVDNKGEVLSAEVSLDLEEYI